MLRPGNSGANDTDDHIELLHRALSGLPEEYQTGHFENDHPTLVEHRILVRADSAGATHGFVGAITAANCDFSIGFPIDQGVRDAMLLVQEEDWVQATETDGSIRDGAWVTELTDLIPLSAWPEDTRLFMRRERPHPGAQLTLFDTVEGFRHTCFITNTQGSDICALELRHRGHARVEDRIRNWKDCGLANLPFDSFVRNEAWVATSLIAGGLLAWSQMVWAHLPMVRARRVLTAVSNGRGLCCTWASRSPPWSVASRVVARSSGSMSDGSFPSA